MPKHVIDAYDDALRAVLEIPSLEDESSGATRVVHCLLRPSFHPECAISIVERPSAAAELTVRVPARSVWALINARQGSPYGNPATDWVKPAVSTERIVLAESAMAWRGEIEQVERSAFPEGPALGIDGMSVDVSMWRPGAVRSFAVWFGAFDESDGRHRLVRTILEIALELARWDASVAGLKDARNYLGG